jgi:hypothetical protein
MQPFYRPEIEELLDKRIDVLYAFTMDNGEEQHCAGVKARLLKCARIVSNLQCLFLGMQCQMLEDTRIKEL